MKRVLLSLATAVSAAAIAGSALAADLPRRSAPPVLAAPVVVPAFTWTGFYVGLHAGYTWADIDANNVGVTPGLAPLIATGVVPGNINLDGDGFVGGAQVGFNYQFGSLVAGLEGDISFLDANSRVTYLDRTGGPTNTVVDFESSVFGTVRGRLGVAFDRTLVYATGGVAFAGVDAKVNVSNPLVPALRGYGSIDETAVGWTLGGGVEYAITNNITVKGEYLYYDLGDTNVTVTEPTFFPGQSATYKAEATGHLARAGVNYKF